MAKKTFLEGAVILATAGIVIKFLGAAFRIPLGNLIGDLGMSYYQSAYPVYVFFLTLATAGIPIAISKMVSERIASDNYYAANRVFKVSFILLFVIGISSSLICFCAADWVTMNMNNPEARYAMKAIAPALLFVPMMAAYRGYFQGMQNMKLTAASQVIEQLFRVVCGLFLAYYLMNWGLKFAAAGASFGATIGAIAGLVTAIAIYLRSRNRLQANIDRSRRGNPERVSAILSRIMIIAVPITIGAAIMPIMNLIDAGIVVRVLTGTGLGADAARSQYGQLAGMVGPLINFPQVLTQAVAMSLVPAISMAHKQKDMTFLRYNVNLGLRTSIMIGLPCAFGLMTLAEPIMLMLYPLQRASAISAAPCLFVMAFGVIFLSTVQTLTGVLQGIGKQLIPVRNLAIGAAVKVYISYNLMGVPEIGVKGAAIGTVAAYIIASTLNLIAVRKYTGVKFDLILTYVKPCFAAAIMSVVVWLSYRIFAVLLGTALSTLFAIGLGAFIYLIMLFATKSITKEEVSKMPKGNKLIKIINKFIKS